MAMSRFQFLPLAFLLAIVFAQQALSADSPPPLPSPSNSTSPSPAPALPADAPSPSASAPSPSPAADISSPPAPPPASPDLSPSTSPPAPAPSPANSTSNSSSPAPTPASSPAPAPGIGGINHADVADVEAEQEHSDGMSAGKKAGIAFGVIACAGFIVFGAMLYKKRQQNIRRAQYSSAARREFL